MAEANELKATTAAVVVWSAANTFEERSLRPQDWRALGAKGEGLELVVWGQANAWTVPRSAVPLDDGHLAALLAREPKFSLREV